MMSKDFEDKSDIKKAMSVLGNSVHVPDEQESGRKSKQSNKSHKKSHSFFNKKTVTVLSCILVLVLSVSGIAIWLTNRGDSEIPETPLSTNLVNTVEQKDSLNDADSFIPFSVYVLNDGDISRQSFSIANQNGEAPDVSLTHKADNEYVINPPQDGYNAGDTYKIKLLDQNIVFADESYIERRDITFSVFKEDVGNVKRNERIKDIGTDRVFSVSDAGHIAIDHALLSEYAVEAGSIIVLPVYDEYGFVNQTAYKVTALIADGIATDNSTLSVIGGSGTDGGRGGNAGKGAAGGAGGAGRVAVSGTIANATDGVTLVNGKNGKNGARGSDGVAGNGGQEGFGGAHGKENGGWWATLLSGPGSGLVGIITSASLPSNRCPDGSPGAPGNPA
jgi:hypothetical protein